MAKFWNRLVASAKGFAAESAQDFRDEYEKAMAPQVAAAAARRDMLAKRLALAPPEERVVAAIAAPYRQTFLGELAAAREDGREPALLLCMALPEDERASWAKLLGRDFGLDEATDVPALLSAMVESADDGTAGDAAVTAVRACHLAAGAAGIGVLQAPQAVVCARPAVTLAAARFGSWDELAEAFLLGERAAAGSNPIGRSVLARTIARLRDDPASPWRTVPWPKALAE